MRNRNDQTVSCRMRFYLKSNFFISSLSYIHSFIKPFRNPERLRPILLYTSVSETTVILFHPQDINLQE